MLSLRQRCKFSQENRIAGISNVLGSQVFKPVMEGHPEVFNRPHNHLSRTYMVSQGLEWQSKRLHVFVLGSLLICNSYKACCSCGTPNSGGVWVGVPDCFISSLNSFHPADQPWYEGFVPSLVASCYAIQLIFLEVLLFAEEKWRESRTRGEERGRRIGEERWGTSQYILYERRVYKKDL